jgi:hypothetical protein
VAEHGDRLSGAQALASVDDLLGCDVLDDFLSTNEEIARSIRCRVPSRWRGPATARFCRSP